MITVLRIRRKFFERLNVKTNWDKEQIKILFEHVYIDLQEEEEIINKPKRS